MIETITSKELAAISHYSERHLRGLAAEGYFKKAIKGVYGPDAIGGVIRYLREQSTENIDNYKIERTRWMQARRQQIELARDEMLKRVISIDAVVKDLDSVAKITSAQIHQNFVVELPGKIAGGLDEIAVRTICSAAADKVLNFLKSRQCWYSEAQAVAAERKEAQ